MSDIMPIDKYAEWYIENMKKPVAPKGEKNKWYREIDDLCYDSDGDPVAIPCECLFYSIKGYRVPDKFWCHCYGGEKPPKGTQFWIPKNK